MGFFKSKTKVLIYGSNGWIGKLFMKYIKTNFPKIIIVEGQSRIDQIQNVTHELNTVKPTHVVSFTGRTHGIIGGTSINTIDYLEYPGKILENVRDNLFGPISLAELCTLRGIHYTYLGTGCIFNSNGLDTVSPEVFNEDSLPNYFGSGYSVVKGFTDRLMKNYKVLNLRIRMPISSVPDERNFITKITKYSKICSIPNSMTVLDDFFPIFIDMMLKKKTGTYNCTNPGTISHNQVLEMYRGNINPEFTWENFTKEEQSTILKSDRSNNALDTLKIEKEYQLQNINKSILNIMKLMKKLNK